MITIKSPREVLLMREAGRVTAKVFEAVKPYVKPGVSTAKLDEIIEKTIRDCGATPSEKGYYGFPASVCASVNEVILHGIPSEKKILRDGDIISLDVVSCLHGYHGDACRTYPVGICSERALRMIAIAEECFEAAIAVVKPGAHVGDISYAIESTAKKHGCSVPREFTGHGIGTHMHEDPSIPCYGTPGTGAVLREGMTLAIEPMILEGRPDVRVLKDGWTVVAKDGKLTSHYENTVVVTKDGCEILTQI